MHQIPAKQAAAETVALEGTPELDAGSAGRYSPSLNNEGEHTMRLLQHVPTAMNRDSQDTPEVRV